MFRSIFAKGIASALILSLAAPAALGFGIGLQPTTVEMEMEPVTGNARLSISPMSIRRRRSL